jgi:hypothetical protein
MISDLPIDSRYSYCEEQTEQNIMTGLEKDIIMIASPYIGHILEISSI